ncbi:inovirus Gp2 family protein [Escherichia coli]|nr:inovirus Gp2 family protein [Escherichia coli]
MNQPIHNDYWLSRFESILNSALVQHRAVSLIRVDLRFPEHMPVTIMDPDPDSAVISRFFESLKAKIQAYQRKKTTCQQACACNQLCVISGVGSLARKKAGNIIT